MVSLLCSSCLHGLPDLGVVEIPLYFRDLQCYPSFAHDHAHAAFETTAAALLLPLTVVFGISLPSASVKLILEVYSHFTG